MKPPPLGEDNKTRERFEVSTDGLRELQAGRTPWSILKELVQNAWDETPGVTVCQVETKGVTILFPAAGGRVVKDNEKGEGTTITLTMPWHPREIPALETMLKRFQPSDCRLVVNGNEVARREPLEIRTVRLKTVLQAGPGEPVVEKERQTELHFLSPKAPKGKESGWLYEMGIPVQRNGLPYDVDVMQKIPMPPNRDTIRMPTSRT